MWNTHGNAHFYIWAYVMHVFVYAGIINYKIYYYQELTCEISYVLFSNLIDNEYS